MAYNYSAYTPNRPVPRPPQRRGKRRLLKFLAIVLILGGGALTAQRLLFKSSPSTPGGSQQAAKKADPEVSGAEGRYLFSGTIVLARAVEKVANKDYNQPFSGMSSFGTFDAGTADLECPVTTNNYTYAQQLANTVFNCRPEWLPTLAKYFQIVNLAGNHTHDMGTEGFPETVEHLQKAGIQAIGNYTPRAKDDICEVVSLPVRLKKKNGQEDKGTLPIAFCTWHYFSFDPEPGEIEVIERYSRIMPVFAFMHAGTEYLARAQPNQVDLAHRIIDAGSPEFVIGNSPHWVQNSEVYKGKLIVYSTGNFIFDQIDPETMRGVSIAVTMAVDYDDNVAKWLALGDCLSRTDDCLERAEQQGLQKIKPKLTYEAIGNTSGNRRVTKKADSAMQKAIEERLNWADTLRELGQ